MMERLSLAEAQIVEQLAYGLRQTEIAEKRGTTVKTVKDQIAKARRKVNARTPAQLVAIYLVMPDVRPA